MTQKERFTDNLMRVGKELAVAGAAAVQLYEVYFDRGYNVGGADEITPEDLVKFGLQVEDVAAFVNAAEQVGNFLHNIPVAQGDYSATFNKVRDDL